MVTTNVGISTNIKSDRPTILRGTVLSNLDEMCEWGDEDNEQLNCMKVSDVEGDVNVPCSKIGMMMMTLTLMI